MSLPAAHLLLLLSALSCQDPEGVGRDLRAEARIEADRLDAALARLTAELGVDPLAGAGSDLAPEEKAELAAARLEEICALAALRPPERTIAPNPERLREILSRPELARARDRHGDLLARALRWLREHLDALLESRGAQSFSQTTRLVVLASAIALVLVAGARLGALLGRRRRTGTQSAPSPLLGLPLEDPSLHLSRARRALEGDPREAIREGLLALLSELERRQLARPDRVKTNRELAAELPSRGVPDALARAITDWLRWYDRTFYSLQAVPPSEASAFLAEVERLQAQLPEAPA